MSERNPGGTWVTAPYADRAWPAAAEGAPRNVLLLCSVPAHRAAAYRAQLNLREWLVAGIFEDAVTPTVIVPTYHWLADGPHMLWDAFRDWLREIVLPTIHLRYDDSRRRGLASECICGEPGCTRWYEP